MLDATFLLVAETSVAVKTAASPEGPPLANAADDEELSAPIGSRIIAATLHCSLPDRIVSDFQTTYQIVTRREAYGGSSPSSDLSRVSRSRC